MDPAPHGRVRRAEPRDIAALVALCVEHARYERAEFDPEGAPARLHAALFTPPPRLHGWVAERDGDLLGYATAASEFSTWAGREYLHLDCLFLREPARGGGLGSQLLGAVTDFARSQAFAELRWQTPAWNEGAIRFYRRHGGVDESKQRFALALGAA